MDTPLYYIWPDGTWIENNALSEYEWKSDDYEVVDQEELLRRYPDALEDSTP